MPRPDSRLIAALLTALVAFGPLSTDLYLPSLPSLTGIFGTDVATVQLTLSVFLAGFAAGQVLYGPLSDRFGRRPLLLGGIVLYVAASIACALAPGIEALILARFLQALGACCGPTLGRAVVRDVYGRERAARVLSYMAMAMALAPAVGPVIGGALTVAFGWRSCFWLLTGFGLVMLAGVHGLLAETNRHKDPAATRPRQLLRNHLTLARHRAYLGYVLVVACTYSGIFAFISGSSFVFIGGLGLSPQAYGLCFGAVVTGYMIGAFAAGQLTLRLGLDRLIVAGTALSSLAGLAMLGLAAAGWLSVAAVIGPYFVFMIGAGLTLSNAQAGAIGPFPAMAGLASGLLSFVQMVLAALVGIAVGHLTDGTAMPMAGAVCGVSLSAALAHRLLVRSQGVAVAKPEEVG